jgi:hypothetical protein
MPSVININFLNGASPFDVYTCDTGYTTCVYVATITSGEIPYQFVVPSIQQGMGSIGLKIVDNTECIIEQNLIL